MNYKSFVLAGSIEINKFRGDENVHKCMAILRDVSQNIVHCLGWYYKDACFWWTLFSPITCFEEWFLGWEIHIRIKFTSTLPSHPASPLPHLSIKTTAQWKPNGNMAMPCTTLMKRWCGGLIAYWSCSSRPKGERKINCMYIAILRCSLRTFDFLSLVGF